MSITAADLSPRVLHTLPGRLRIALGQSDAHTLEAAVKRLRSLPGVRTVQGNTLTGTLLALYDPDKVAQAQILHAAGARDTTSSASIEQPSSTSPAQITRPHTSLERSGSLHRARIAIKGLDRNPRLARHIVNRLVQQDGVQRAIASPLTSRVLVEFASDRADIDDIMSNLANIEIPDLPDEDDPVYPLDPAPLLQSSARTAGSALGLGLIAVGRAWNNETIFAAAEPAGMTAAIIGILRGLPAIRDATRRWLGPNLADVVFSLPNIVALAFSNSPFGLAVTGLEAMRLLTEVVARRRAWRRYEARVLDGELAQPGATARIEAGERSPLAANVLDGHGTAIGADGLPMHVAPGETIPAGARVYGGPFIVHFQEPEGFDITARPAPLAPSLYDRYQQALSPISLLAAIGTGIVTRSPARALAALLLMSPRPAIIGMEAANIGANARVLRAGGIVVGTRPDRTIRRPDLVLLDSSRLLTDGFEIAGISPLASGIEEGDLATRATAVALASGSPWGGAFRAGAPEIATEGHFAYGVATAVIGGERFTLSQWHDDASVPPALRMQARGNILLALRRDDGTLLGLFLLRPRLAHGVGEFLNLCRKQHVPVAVLADEASLASREIARRAGVQVIAGAAREVIRSYQSLGSFVLFIADAAPAGAAFAACDLAVGLIEPRSQLPARCDLLAPDFPALSAIVQAGVERDRTVRDAVCWSLTANVGGVVWGVRGIPGIRESSRFMYYAALATLAEGWVRLRGGERPGHVLMGLADPHPERWSQLSPDEALRFFHSRPTGLTAAEAAERQRRDGIHRHPPPVLQALEAQLKSPLNWILAGSAGIVFAMGSPVNAALIGATIAGNVLVNTQQSYQVRRAMQTIQQLNEPTATVLRDGSPVTVPAQEVVPGDVLVLESGAHVIADARILEAHRLEMDEASLTGESLPVSKGPDRPGAAGRIILAGSDVVTGSGRAVVVAVGQKTQMGALTAAVNVEDTQPSPLDVRLSQMLRVGLPLALGAGALVTGSGVLRGGSLLASASVGMMVALSAIPEGLPALAQVGAAGVARRMASRGALVRRLNAVEALGRVDVACADKTGTLTQGIIRLAVLSDGVETTAAPASSMPSGLVHVLRAAALASPHPDSPGANAHPTDIAVIQGAIEAGLEHDLYGERTAEAPFDPMRGFHAAVIGGKLYAKGAPEIIAARCMQWRHGNRTEQLDDAGREQLLGKATELSQRGLRVLLVAEGRASEDPSRLEALTALGFVGLRDPLRSGAKQAVQTCHTAGIRVVMLTGDHPATAKAIATEAGLLHGTPHEVMTGGELAGLANGELDASLEKVTVVARATPLDKLRIIESLQRRKHVVAMTGDGVNDAPALRLADVGVAMGRGGTEVARQTASVVLVDDDFATLVDALVEGRSFWRNTRRALGLLVGGNLGELVLIVGASALGLATPLNAAQVLAVNFITDLLPGLAVALQQPEHNHLSDLQREGATALDRPLRQDILRRTASTAIPSLGAYLAALAAAGPAQASSVAFTSIIATQLAQTLETGRTADSINMPVLAAVGGSAALLGASLAVPALRAFLGLAMPNPASWLLIGGSIPATMLLSALWRQNE